MVVLQRVTNVSLYYKPTMLTGVKMGVSRWFILYKPSSNVIIFDFTPHPTPKWLNISAVVTSSKNFFFRFLTILVK